MDRKTDHELLRLYATNGSEDAFRALVERHLGMVRGVAWRQLGNDPQADEASQAVFIALARKAQSLPENVVIAGWLFRAARFAAAKLARDEGRRAQREKEAAMKHAEALSDPSPDEVWNQIAPHLNLALQALNEKDRQALLLRFFESRPFAEVGQNLGVSEDAAKMRVGRALEKLRDFFRRRGMVLGVTVLAGALTNQASATASPQLAATTSTAALKPQTASTAGHILADAILRHLLLARLKPWLLLVAALLATSAAISIASYHYGWFGLGAQTPGWPPPAWPAQQ